MRPSRGMYLPLRPSFFTNADTSSYSISLQRNFAFRLLILSNILLGAILGATWLFLFTRIREESLPSTFVKVDSLPTKWTEFDWWTEYSGKNDTEVDALWDAILPSHGLVAVDSQWAAEQQWPDSLSLPSDESKKIYLLEAYHLLHCVKIIRKTFWEAVKREPYTYLPPHAGHCFDYLRQSIQCNADNTPLYSYGDYTAGVGQLRKCKDWSNLRDWATEHTACFRDSVEQIPIKDHFGFCDGGIDGLPDLKNVAV